MPPNRSLRSNLHLGDEYVRNGIKARTYANHKIVLKYVVYLYLI